MTKDTAIIFLLLAIVGCACPFASAQRKDNGPVVIELFTSEGCSSCPPADSLLEEIHSQFPDSVAPISEHVDYWNYLGWADPASSAFFTERQKSYAERLSRNNIYTPQLVVNGVVEVVGSNRVSVHKLLSQALKNPPKALRVSARKNSDERKIAISVSFPLVSLEGDIIVALTEDGVTSHVKAGENVGRRLMHCAVARKIMHKTLSALHHGALNLEIELRPEWKAQKLNAIVFLQDLKTGRVTASGKASVEM